MTNRWWTYQKERFPVFVHGPLVVVFCLSVMLFSALQSEQYLFPDGVRVAGAVISTLILFFQLRVADEWKDAGIDSKYRPHRAVPRGLVTLQELRTLAYAGAAIQFVIAIYIDFGLVPLLLLVWLYVGLMTKEFFIPERLREMPLAYLFSHMLIMPLIAFYVSAFDWLCECRALPGGLGWLLALSFFLGLVLEIGRKIRMPEHERTGVETYSALWGVRPSVTFWVASVGASVGAFALASRYIPEPILHLGVAACVLFVAVVTTVALRLIEASSGVVVLALYVGLGPLQALLA